MERWLSWSKAHDWKSCVPHKGTEGSNPSLSARKNGVTEQVTPFFVQRNASPGGGYCLKKQHEKTGRQQAAGLSLSVYFTPDQIARVTLPERRQRVQA